MSSPLKEHIKRLLFILLVRHSLSNGDAREEQDDERREYRRQNCNPFNSFNYVQWDDENAPPQDNFTEIIGVAADFPQTCECEGKRLLALGNVEIVCKVGSRSRRGKIFIMSDKFSSPHRISPSASNIVAHHKNRINLMNWISSWCC
jgi:hypothetical protein